MKENARKLIKKHTKGILKEKLLERLWWINCISLIPIWIIILIVGLSSLTNINFLKVILDLLIFYHISSILFIKYIDVYEYNNIHFIKQIIFIMRIPVYITQYFSIIIFKLLLIDKYPEMTQENFIRYTKLKKIKHNINKHKFLIYEER
jgi:hypothetical protein